MAYCTTADVDAVLAQALTSATYPTSQAKRNLLQIGNVRDKNNIPDSIVNQYIKWGDEEINAELSELYNTPFCETADFETTLVSDVSEYMPYIEPYLILEKNCALEIGDIILITDGTEEERVQIEDEIGDGIYSVYPPITYPFQSGTRVIRLKFPDPIPWVSVRLAAANVYDKYFAAQVSPNISDYGKLLRNQARQKINDILNGRTILHGVHRIGRRLYDSTITSQYGLPHGSEPNKDIDQLT
jgi:hypothetical protein